MKAIFRSFIALVIAITMQHDLFAQKAKYQSVFIYNFSKYIKWPDAYRSDKFVIGVIGDPEVLQFLKEMAATKQVTNGMPIEIVEYSDVNKIGQCHILYLSEEMCKNMDQVYSVIAAMPVLIVTDKPGMAKKGAIINFTGEGEKIRFELNMNKARERGLMIAGSLASLAIII